jgi:hypothetical protein
MRTAQECIELCIQSYLKWSNSIGYYSPRTLIQALDMIDKSARMIEWCEEKEKWVMPDMLSEVKIDLSAFEGQNFIIDDVLENIQ